MGNDDYGHFGKGTEGYIHYMQAFNETQKGGGGRKPSQNSGCLTTIISVITIMFIAVALIAN